MTKENVQDEFERMFLVKSLPTGVFQSRSKEIYDVYFPRDEAHCKLRIRKSGDSYEMTKKEVASNKDSSHLIEYTIPLSQEEFLALKKIEGKEVRKIRYYYEADGVVYEIGVFQDALSGLVTVDVEFKSKKDLDSFRVPEWFLAEVTQEAFLAGGALCGKAYADIAAQLEVFGYKPVR